MFDIGFSELLLCAVIALLVLGPERLPKAARTLGLIIGKIKRSISGIQEELERQIRTEELKEKLKDPYAVFSDDKPVSNAEPDTKTTASSAEDSANQGKS